MGFGSDGFLVLDFGFGFGFGFCYEFCSTEMGGVIEKLNGGGGGGGGGWLRE